MKELPDPFVFKAHESHIIDLAFTPDSQFLLSAGMDNVIHQWVIGGWSLERTYSGHEKSVNAINLTSDGSRFVTASSDRNLLLWEMGNSEPSGRLSTKGNSARLSNKDSFIAAVEGPHVTLMDFTRREVLKRFHPFEKRTTAIAFSPDESMLVVGGQGDEIRFYELPSCDQIREISQAHEGFVLSIGFSPDGRQMASTGYEGKLRLWNPGKGDLIGEVPLENQGIQSLAFSPDGQIIAVASDHRLTMVDSDSMGIIQKIDLKPKGVYCLAFSPDGKWLACGSADKRIRIWEWD
ncbi:MAG: WD40 repeat domain-containing protein [Brevefilum sp.]